MDIAKRLRRVSSHIFTKCIKLTSSSIIAHYDEDVNMMRESIESVLQRLPSHKSHRVIIYSKGDRNKAGLRELLEISDEVVAIPNVGREGETYLVSPPFFAIRVFWPGTLIARVEPYMPTLQQARYGSGRSYHLHAGKFPFPPFSIFF